MTAIITTKTKIDTAITHKSQVDSSVTDRNYYFFIGRSMPWDDETSPPTPLDTIKEYYEIWDNIIAFKRLQENDISLVLQRFKYDDTSETIYFPHDDEDEDLLLHPTSSDNTDGSNGDWNYAGTLESSIVSYTAGSHYCVTSDLNVYKCISNRNSSNEVIKSANSPTGTSTSIIQTADGYRWKYMFTISASGVEKFTTNDWIPVKTLDTDDGSNQWDVQSAAVSGSISHIRVDNSGSGYSNTHTGIAVTAPTNNQITLDAGASASDDIYNNSTIEITSGTGSGQTRLISDYDGNTKIATVDSNWSTNPDATSNFSIYPTITISGSGSGATAKPVLSGGTIVDVEVTNEGSGYSYTTITVTGGGGSNADLTPLLSPVGGHGADPVNELGGFFLMFNTVINPDELDFPQGNNHRINGIITDLRNYDNTLATATTRSGIKILVLSGISGTFEEDELITTNGSGTPTARVIQFDSTTGALSYFQDSTTGFIDLSAAETVTGGTSGATALIDSITNEEVKKYSGNIIHLEKHRSLNWDVNLTKEIKIVLEH